MKKIAIVGTAPTWVNAPFNDPSWEIWGMFGTSVPAPRLDRLYELHDRRTIIPLAEQTYPDGAYWKKAASMGENFITRDAYEQCPQATRFNFQKLLEKYGPHFSSSVAWLIAQAIEEKPDTIGLWGVNMQHDTEYGHQKPACCFFMGWARGMGIDIQLPESCELLSVAYQYGLENEPRSLAVMSQKRTELENGMANAEHHLLQQRDEVNKFKGALEILRHFEKNWK